MTTIISVTEILYVFWNNGWLKNADIILVDLSSE